MRGWFMPDRTREEWDEIRKGIVAEIDAANFDAANPDWHLKKVAAEIQVLRDILVARR